MRTVKGSKQIKMIVVPHRPGRIMWVRTAILSLVLLVGTAAYFWGHHQGVDVNGDARLERDMLLVSVAELQDNNALLDQQILNLVQAGEVDKEALNSVQGTILTLREQISQLEEDVLFYKQILSPNNDEIGLVIGQLDLLRAEIPGAIRFKLELKQQGNNENVIVGYTNVNIMGMQNGSEVSIPLRSLSDTIESLDIKLQFRYFQNIEGILELPENFEPQKVQILAVAEGDSSKTVQKSFGWVVQE